MVMNRRLYFSLLAVASVLTGAVAFMLGLLPFRALWREFGGKATVGVYLLGMAMAAAFSQWGILASLAMSGAMAITFSLIEDAKVMSPFGAFFSSLVVTLSCTGIVAGFIQVFTGLFRWSSFRQTLDAYWLEVQKLSQLPTPVALEQVLPYFPGFFVLVLMLSFGFMLVIEDLGERKISNQGVPRLRLFHYEVPGVFIWVLIAALLCSFGLKAIPELFKVVAKNILIVVSFVYFIQGLAVVSSLMRNMRLGKFWQILVFAFLFPQYVFVTLLGVVDYWAGFRVRKKKNKEDYQSF